MLANVLDGVRTAYLSIPRGFGTPVVQTTQLTLTRTMYTRIISMIAFFRDGRQVVTGSDHITFTRNVEKGALVGRSFRAMMPYVQSLYYQMTGELRAAQLMIWSGTSTSRSARGTDGRKEMKSML